MFPFGIDFCADQWTKLDYRRPLWILPSYGDRMDTVLLAVGMYIGLLYRGLLY